MFTIFALSALLIAAVSGLLLAASIIKKQIPSLWTSLVHGTFAATGLGLTGVAFYNHGSSSALRIAFSFLLLAALGGFLLATFHGKKKLAPLVVVGVHALLAVSGFLTLLSAAIGA